MIESKPCLTGLRFTNLIFVFLALHKNWQKKTKIVKFHTWWISTLNMRSSSEWKKLDYVLCYLTWLSVLQQQTELFALYFVISFWGTWHLYNYSKEDSIFWIIPNETSDFIWESGDICMWRNNTAKK